MNNPLDIDRSQFGADPFGYSASTHLTWSIMRSMAGFPVEIDQPANEDDLKNPVLWMSHAHALSTAAKTLLLAEPGFAEMPFGIRSICDRQYCSVALMLVGYSLEISLKSMLIIKHGIDGYKEIERKVQHHRLEELSEFIHGLTNKDKAILRGLTCYVYWAGRYPDPGKSRLSEAEDIFRVSEQYQITAAEIFELSIRIAKNVNTVIAKANIG